MLRTRFALGLLLMIGLPAALALAGGAGAHPAVAPAPVFDVAAALGLACPAISSIAARPAAAGVGGSPAITIVCGICSDPGCVDHNINTTCRDIGGSLGRCGAEPSFPKCSDNHFYCLCDVEPQPGL